MLVIPSITGAAEQAEGVPLRIVSLSPIQTKNVFLLDAGSQLVGNTTYCTKPEAARSIEKVGSVMEINIEKIAGLRPDLILASNLTLTIAGGAVEQTRITCQNVPPSLLVSRDLRSVFDTWQTPGS